MKQRTGRQYQLTAKGVQMLKDDQFGTQPKLIAQALHKKGQATSSELAAAIESKVETRQPVMRVVSFYLTTWKSDGIVKEAKGKAPKAAKRTKKAKPPASPQPATQAVA